MLQRDVVARIPLLTVLIMQYRVAVREGSAPCILAGNPHCVARGHQRCKRKMLTHTPIEINLTTTHGSAISQDFFNQRVRLEILWHRRDPL